MNDIPSGFNMNMYEPANNSIIFLYDSLKVIDYSLTLIRNNGRHEFNSVIATQLRLIYTKSNDYYDKSKYEKMGLTEEQNKFSLFDLLKNYKLTDMPNTLGELKHFPKFDYENLPKRSEHFPYYWVNEDAIYDYNSLTVNDFLTQNIAEVTDFEGNHELKSVEYVIKKLANKANGAHYQHVNNKMIMRLIMMKDRLLQNIGYVTIKSLLPIVEDVMEDMHYSDYKDRSQFRDFGVASAIPKFNEE